MCRKNIRVVVFFIPTSSEVWMPVIKMFENHPKDKITIIPNITLILAHGAGAPADSVFMTHLGNALAGAGVKTMRFEFPYMERTRIDGRKRPPDRQPALLSHFRQVIRAVSRENGGKIIVGGKSMGGRMASLLAAEPELVSRLGGCVCFGYPFHRPGKPDRWRVEHFGRFHCPVLIIQGARDPFGKRKEVDDCPMVISSVCRIHWLEGGDHDFRPLVRQPETQDQLIESAAKTAAAFLADLG
jgi:hypothetical protein